MAKLKSLAVAAVCATAAACSHSPAEQSSAHARIASFGWPYSQAVVLDGADTCGTQATLWLRHSEDYPYRNLWLELTRVMPDSTTRRDTLRLELCDPYGRWHGSGFGPSRQLSAELREIPAFDTAHVAVRHIMRLDTLRGIEEIGIAYTLSQTQHNPPAQ